jgi:hypothetical protein
MAIEEVSVTRMLIVAVCGLVLAACGKAEPPDTAESLMADPERLKALRVECKADHDSVGDAPCNRAAEATRRHFMGSGTPYSPAPNQ